MRWDDIDKQVCSVARALSVVGERWTMLILRDAFLGTRRFDQFQSNLALPAIASQRGLANWWSRVFWLKSPTTIVRCAMSIA